MNTPAEASTRSTAPVLVLGCPRSGVTMVVRALVCCGAFVGCVPSSGVFGATNRKVFRKVEEPVLGALGIDELVCCVKFPPTCRGMLPFPSDLPTFMDGWMREQGQKLPAPWVYREAGLAYRESVPRWLDAFPSLRVVVVRREPADLIFSCAHTAYMNRPIYRTPAQWAEWVARYDLLLTSVWEVVPEGQRVEVWPTRFVDGDFSEMERAVSFLGLNWTDRAVEEYVNAEWRSTRDTPGEVRHVG